MTCLGSESVPTAINHFNSARITDFTEHCLDPLYVFVLANYRLYLFGAGIKL